MNYDTFLAAPGVVSSICLFVSAVASFPDFIRCHHFKTSMKRINNMVPDYLSGKNPKTIQWGIGFDRQSIHGSLYSNGRNLGGAGVSQDQVVGFSHTKLKVFGA